MFASLTGFGLGGAELHTVLTGGSAGSDVSGGQAVLTGSAGSFGHLESSILIQLERSDFVLIMQDVQQSVVAGLADHGRAGGDGGSVIFAPGYAVGSGGRIDVTGLLFGHLIGVLGLVPIVVLTVV